MLPRKLQEEAQGGLGRRNSGVPAIGVGPLLCARWASVVLVGAQTAYPPRALAMHDADQATGPTAAAACSSTFELCPGIPCGPFHMPGPTVPSGARWRCRVAEPAPLLACPSMCQPRPPPAWMPATPSLPLMVLQLILLTVSLRHTHSSSPRISEHCVRSIGSRRQWSTAATALMIATSRPCSST